MIRSFNLINDIYMKALIIVLLVLGLLVQFLNIVSAARVDYHQHYRAYMGETFVMSGVSVLIYVVLIGYFAVKGLDDYNI